MFACSPVRYGLGVARSVFFTGNSLGQLPSRISGTCPLDEPPELNRSLGGVGDADALLGGDAVVVGGGVIVVEQSTAYFR